MLFILFGLAGSGKNYVGNILKNHFNFYFFDGDQLLTEEMQQYLREKKLFTDKIRHDLAEIMIAKINLLKKDHPNIVFAQALYKEKNRLQIKQHFPDAHFILIEAHEKNIIARLCKREDWIDADFAEKMRVHFDAPTLPHHKINNNQDEKSIIEQFEKILKAL